MPEEGEARERWIEKSAVLFDLILQSVNKEMFEHIKHLVEADDSGPRACRAKLGKKVLWSLEEETSCIKDLWQLPIIPWNGKTPIAATAAAAKAAAGGDATAPTDGVLEAVKKVQQQQTHAVNMLRAFGCMVVFHVPKEKRGKLEASGRWGVHLGIAKDHKGWLLWDLTTQKLTVARDVKFLESLYYKEWKQQQQKLPSTPLIVEADEVQRPSRQVEVAVSEEEMSGVTEEGGAAEVEQQQQHEPKWHLVRRLLNKEVRLEIVKTHQQAADIFTKRLAEADHWKGMKLAGMSVH
ncbi:hypothetical protein CLOP_g19792 [Closterium sp. NIES-67]|nr:hypothetical protein CLOP_g19792 [Closterium sp. NIES-67]